jgi:hypothetical protein
MVLALLIQANESAFILFVNNYLSSPPSVYRPNYILSKTLQIALCSFTHKNGKGAGSSIQTFIFLKQ